MNWFKNLKIRTKILVGFLSVIIIASIFSYFRDSVTNTIRKNLDTMYLDRLVPIQDLGNVNALY